MNAREIVEGMIEYRRKKAKQVAFSVRERNIAEADALDEILSEHERFRTALEQTHHLLSVRHILSVTNQQHAKADEAEAIVAAALKGETK